jgi:competence protein ComEC
VGGHAIAVAPAPAAPIYIVAFAIVAGDALGNLNHAPPLWTAVALASAAMLSMLASRHRLAILFAALALSAAAAAPVDRLLHPPPDRASVRRYSDGSTLTVEGRLAREIEQVGDRYRLFVQLEWTHAPGGRPERATALIQLMSLYPPDCHIGDRLRVTAKLRFPRNNGNPGEFDYASFMARSGIAATMFVPAKSVIEVIPGPRDSFAALRERLRSRIAAFIDATLVYPESAEMRALVIGDRGGIDDALRDKFALTGMAHLLVISGLHLGFVASAAFAIARLILALFPALMIRGHANKLAALAAAIAVITYSEIAGHHVSTVRALVMVLMYVAAIMLDRPREVLASLALAATMICLMIPGSTADIGAQLSFASVIAIILGMRLYSAWWRRWLARRVLIPHNAPRRYVLSGWFVGYLAVSFWALLGTAPLTAFHFNQFSIVGLIANAVVVPIIGAGGTVLGLAACALSFIWMAPARLLMLLAGQLLALGTLLAGWFEGLPGAWMRSFTPTPLEIALAYGSLMVFLLPSAHAAIAVSLSPRITARGVRLAAAAALTVAMIADGGYWLWQRYLNPDLRITFLAVGQGDGAVIQFPGSRVMLIDAGGSQRDGFDPGERIVAPFLWSRKIMRVDYLVASHPELDHFGGFIFIANNFRTREFWTINAPSPDARYLELLETLASRRVRLRLIDTSAPPMTIGGVAIDFLNPPPDWHESRNNTSLVMALRFGLNRFLFTGDLEAKGEHAMIGRHGNLRATLLKVPHHGSHTSSTAELIEAVHPALALMSLGYMNRFGLPDAGVMARYRDAGVRVLRTDQVGAVMVNAARERMRFSAYRAPPP